VMPSTLGIASRIPGVTPAAVSLLLVYLKKGKLASIAHRAETPIDINNFIQSSTETS
jgi:hypothetical protein